VGGSRPSPGDGTVGDALRPSPPTGTAAVLALSTHTYPQRVNDSRVVRPGACAHPCPGLVAGRRAGV